MSSSIKRTRRESRNKPSRQNTEIAPTSTTTSITSTISTSEKEELKDKSTPKTTENKEPEQSEVQCGICLEESIKLQGLLSCCKHTFCFDCIDKWSQTSNTCPLCKKRFKQISKVDLSVPSSVRKPKKIRVKHTEKRSAIDSDFDDWFDEESFPFLVNSQAPFFIPPLSLSLARLLLNPISLNLFGSLSSDEEDSESDDLFPSLAFRMIQFRRNPSSSQPSEVIDLTGDESSIINLEEEKTNLPPTSTSNTIETTTTTTTTTTIPENWTSSFPNSRSRERVFRSPSRRTKRDGPY